MPPVKCQSLEAPSSVVRFGSFDVERAVLHSASLTLRSRTSGRFFGLVCSLLCVCFDHCVFACTADTADSTTGLICRLIAFDHCYPYNQHLCCIAFSTISCAAKAPADELPTCSLICTAKAQRLSNVRLTASLQERLSLFCRHLYLHRK